MTGAQLWYTLVHSNQSNSGSADSENYRVVNSAYELRIHACIRLSQFLNSTGMSTYLESDFFQQTVLGCMSATTIDQYSSEKLALSAVCRGMGRHTCDDVLVLELGDKDGAVAFGGVPY